MDAPELAGLNLRRRSRFRSLPELLQEPRYANGLEVINFLQNERKRERRHLARNEKHTLFTTTYTDAYSIIEEARKMNILNNMFLEADEDGSGDITLDEFRKAVNKEGMRKLFGALGIQPHETVTIFKSMQGPDGTCKVQEFMAALAREKQKLDKECQELFG